MNRVNNFLFILNVIWLIFAQSTNSLGDINLLRRSSNDIFVLSNFSTNEVRILASSFIIDCQLLPNAHYIIEIHEHSDEIWDEIPNEFLVNGIETSEEIFEIITFKTPRASPIPVTATHVFCDYNHTNCRYYDFMRN